MAAQKLGITFSDSVYLTHKKSRAAVVGGRIGEGVEDTDTRILLFTGVMVLGLGILFLRIFHLTVIRGSYYRKLAQDNRIRELRIPAPRGIIYDRNNIPLVRNIPVFISKNGDYVFENKSGNENDNYSESVAREYIYGDLFAHVLGYTGEVSREELDKISAAGKESEGESLSMGDVVGKMGIEKYYDSYLRGINGKEMYEVDAMGNTVRMLGRVDPKAGKNMNISLDLKLQQVAGREMAGKKGAVIVTDPVNGEVLALYSSPSFDPNRFIRLINAEEYFSDPDMPLFDRGIGGTYPPGSTFKIATAIAALESGKVTGETQIEDTGVLKIGSFSFGNWNFLQYGKTEGFMNIVTAIKRSNDIFFYKIGEMTGVDVLSQWATKLGMGKATGIDLDGEASGLVPDPTWMKAEKGENWYLGNTYHYAIGQGDLLATPLQINQLANIVASGGELCVPHVAQSGVFRQEKKKTCEKLPVSEKSLSLVREGMRQACENGGTAWPLFGFSVQNDKLKIDGINFLENQDASSSAFRPTKVSLACKTGTAEFGNEKKTHAWLTVFAPVQDPQISITVLVEGGGEGSTVASPVAKRILEEWFTR